MSFFKLQQQRQTFFIYNFSKCAREPRLLTNKQMVENITEYAELILGSKVTPAT